MRNYIHKLAKDNIKKNKKFYKTIFLSMFFSFFMIMFVCMLLSSLEKYDYEKRAYLHGRWDVIVEDVDDLAIIDELKYVSKQGVMSIGGEVLFNNQSIGYIGAFDEAGYELANLHIIEGRFAKNEDEIVVEKSVLISMGLKLNEIVEFNYQVNDSIKTSTYKVVGVIEDYVYYWNTKALSFITCQIDGYEKNIMLKGSIPLLLWDETDLLVKESWECGDGGMCLVGYTTIHNNYNYPHYEIKNGSYLNESPMLGYAVEIIIFSFIAIMASIMSSLEKRESQFVLLRCMGMTYKQLKKLIIYEGYVLAFIAFLLAGVISVVLSLTVMGIYALISESAFVWSVNLYSLGVELTIAIIVMIIGIILPTITVYQLPLTSKKGEYYYHPKKRKIRKPTLNSFVKNKLLNSKVYSSFIYIILCFILFRGFMMIDTTINYHNNDISSNKNYDYIWRFHELETDMTPLLNDDDIQIISSSSSDSVRLRWDDMNQETPTITFRRGDFVNGRIVCVKDDYEVVSYLNDKGYDIKNELDDDEALVIIPNHNYATPLESNNYNEYDVDPMRKKDGLYASDIGLKEDNNVYMVTWIDDEEIEIPFKIDKTIHVEESLRDYFDCYTIIVNEETFKNITSIENNNYYVIKTNNDVANDKVRRFIYNAELSHDGFISILIDVQFEHNEQTGILITEYYNDMIHTVMMVFVFMFLIYVLRMLSLDKEKKTVCLYRNIGMCKKEVYYIHSLYSLIIFVFALISIFIVWVFYYKVTYDGFINVLNYLKYRMVYYGVICSLTFVVYMIVMLLPVKKVLKENPLYFKG